MNLNKIRENFRSAQEEYDQAAQNFRSYSRENDYILLSRATLVLLDVRQSINAYAEMVHLHNTSRLD
jgi:hypothetical protein